MLSRKRPALIKERYGHNVASELLLHVNCKVENVYISMATGSGGSLLTGERLHSQGIYKGETRDLPIHDHVTLLSITEDKDGRWSISLNNKLHPTMYILLYRNSDLFITTSVRSCNQRRSCDTSSCS